MAKQPYLGKKFVVTVEQVDTVVYEQRIIVRAKDPQDARDIISKRIKDDAVADEAFIERDSSTRPLRISRVEEA